MLTSFDIISKRRNSSYFTPWFLPEEQPSKVDDSWEIFEEQDMVRSPDCIFSYCLSLNCLIYETITVFNIYVPHSL